MRGGINRNCRQAVQLRLFRNQSCTEKSQGPAPLPQMWALLVSDPRFKILPAAVELKGVFDWISWFLGNNASWPKRRRRFVRNLCVSRALALHLLVSGG